ncbi:sensor histidine kinase [Colwelliaceae bacterium BS250]
MIHTKNLTTSKMAENKRLRFWLLQLCGWLPVAILFLPIFGDDDFLSMNALIFSSSVTLLALFTSTRLRLIYQFLNTKISRGSFWLVLILTMSLFAAICVDIIHHTIWFAIAQLDSQYKPVYQNQPFLVVTGFLWFVYVFWSSLYLTITKQDNLNHLLVHQQQLELLVKENKIKSLLEQLNPHFMFNTINNIRSLILQDADRARDMLLSFADIMRYQMNVNDDALVPLKDELNFVMEFIELNRLQLGKRLNFTQSIDTSLLTNCIPRMALQLLVENAIKHGFNQSAKPAILQVTIKNELLEGKPQAWFMSVKNNGVLNHKKSDSGIGLQNLNDRLTLSYEDNYKLTLTEENNVVECKILFNY